MSSGQSQVATTPKTYSPFWAILVVFLAFITLQGLQLWNDYTVRDNLLKTQSDLTDALTNAKKVTAITEAVTRDIFVMSKDSPEARKIATEFNIRYETKK